MPGASSRGAGTPAAAGRRRGVARVVLPLVAVAATAVVLSAALEGPAHIVQPTGTPGAKVSPPAAPTQRPFRMQPGAYDPTLSAIVGAVLLVLAILLAIGLLVLLVRLLLPLLRRRRHRVRAVAPISAAGLQASPELVDAPVVQRGIAAAIAALQEPREPSDAIVRAWLGLQQSAEDAGVARAPSETPTEFTGRVLSRSSADRPALRTLLALYLRARFGGDPISAADAAAAVTALRTLESSWRSAPVEADR
jgi:hypothetical protein